MDSNQVGLGFQEKKYITVDTQEKIEQLLDHIAQSEVLAIDTETTGLNVRKDLIIGWSVCGVVGESYYMPTKVWNPSTEQLEDLYISGKLAELIAKKVMSRLVGKKLVAHNASFDFRIIKNYYGIDLLSDLWVDTGMLVHTVEEEGAFGYGSPFALKSIAIMNQEALGLDMQSAANEEQIKLKESVYRNGGSTTKTNFEIYKADLDILSEYGAADTDLTLRICNLYLAKLKAEGLEKFFFEEEVMPIYKEVTVPMEDRGVRVDIDLLTETDKQITQDLQDLKQTVIKSITSLPQGQKWIIDKALEAYPPSNKGSWVQNLCKLYALDLPMTPSGKYSITAKNIERLEDGAIKKFLQTGDLDLLQLADIGRISLQMWKDMNDGDPINIQSTSHLGDLVFNYLDEKSLEKTATGRDKFDMDVLDAISGKYAWAESLRVYNKLLKIKSTYIDRFLNSQEDGRHFPYFKQNGTVSGRYGSDMQQLPKPKEEGEDVEIVVRYNNIVRAFFIAGKGRKFIDADFTSLEPHCFASVSGDERLREIFNKGWDFYSTIAIRTEKLDEQLDKYPNGVSADTKAPNFLKKIDPVKRQQAKSYSLGIAYGMESYALAMTLEIPRAEADKLIEGYLDGFPQLKEWRIKSREQVKEVGFIKNYLGRVRHFPKAKRIYDAFGDRILDWKFRRELEGSYGKEQVDRLYKDYKNAMNGCLNYQLQSLAAGIVNRAALQINRKAKELGMDAKVVLQIHDQLVIDVQEDQAEEFAKHVQYLMEQTTVLPGVTLKAPPEIATNLRDGH
jgi:DNA polymerase I-like protein with 3'-5' exonuclease and polymerase domains